MKHAGLLAITLTTAFGCFGQNHPRSSTSGYGNVVYPGTPHPPTLWPGYSYYPTRVNHPNHGRTAVVPYPVIVGGYGYGYGYGGYYNDPSQQQGAQDGQPPISSDAAPSVVINQTFVPDRAAPMVQDYPPGPPDADQPPSGMRLYEGPRPQPYTPPARRAASDDQPTLVLIALKDHTIVTALGYWVESGSLHYVSAERTLNQVSLDLVDRDLSQRLNDERNVEFKLPKAQ